MWEKGKVRSFRELWTNWLYLTLIIPLYRFPEKHKWSILHSNHMRHTLQGKLHLEGLQNNQKGIQAWGVLAQTNV